MNWSSHKETLEDSLNSLMKVSPEEVVKFLQDILDALFNILVQNDDPPKFDNLVFKCLLRLIEIVSDLKYQHFQSVSTNRFTFISYFAEMNKHLHNNVSFS